VSLTDVLYVEDDSRFVDLVSRRIVATGLYTVRVARSGREAYRLIDERAPEMLLLDLGLPDMDGAEVIRGLRRRGSELPVFILSAVTTPARALDALLAGGEHTAYYSKHELEHLVAAMADFRAGGAPVSSGITRGLLRELIRLSPPPASSAPALTSQELRILRLLENHTYEQMAGATCTSINTVREHVRSIYGKLGVERAAEAVGLAYRRGLLIADAGRLGASHEDAMAERRGPR
jgi:DNA-binding NarL/FixJ family response regulator